MLSALSNRTRTHTSIILVLLSAHVTVQYGTFPVLVVVRVPFVAATNVWYSYEYSLQVQRARTRDRVIASRVFAGHRGDVLLLFSIYKFPGVFRVDYP